MEKLIYKTLAIAGPAQIKLRHTQPSHAKLSHSILLSHALRGLVAPGSAMSTPVMLAQAAHSPALRFPLMPSQARPSSSMPTLGVYPSYARLSCVWLSYAYACYA